MKRRNIKLLASITSFMLVMAVTAIGVFAATQVAVGISTQVSFTASSVNGSVAMEVTGYKTATASETGVAEIPLDKTTVKYTDNNYYNISDSTIYLKDQVAVTSGATALPANSSTTNTDNVGFTDSSANVSVSNWLTDTYFVFKDTLTNVDKDNGTTGTRIYTGTEGADGLADPITFTITIINTSSSVGINYALSLGGSMASNNNLSLYMKIGSADAVAAADITPTLINPSGSLTITITAVPTSSAENVVFATGIIAFSLALTNPNV